MDQLPVEDTQVRWLDVLSGFDDLAVAPRADCCSAAARFRVVLASSAELVLCGHHVRRSMAALEAAGAVAYDVTGRPVDADAVTGPA